MSIDLNRLARIYAVQAQIVGKQATILSMEAANQHRLSLGHTIAYDEAAFAKQADDCWSLSNELSFIAREG